MQLTAIVALLVCGTVFAIACSSKLTVVRKGPENKASSKEAKSIFMEGEKLYLEGCSHRAGSKKEIESKYLGAIELFTAAMLRARNQMEQKKSLKDQRLNTVLLDCERLMAFCYERMGRYQDSRQHFHQALEVADYTEKPEVTRCELYKFFLPMLKRAGLNKEYAEELRGVIRAKRQLYSGGKTTSLDAQNPSVKKSYAVATVDLALLLSESGNLEEANSYGEEALKDLNESHIAYGPHAALVEAVMARNYFQNPKTRSLGQMHFNNAISNMQNNNFDIDQDIAAWSTIVIGTQLWDLPGERRHAEKMFDIGLSYGSKLKKDYSLPLANVVDRYCELEIEAKDYAKAEEIVRRVLANEGANLLRARVQSTCYRVLAEIRCLQKEDAKSLEFLRAGRKTLTESIERCDDIALFYDLIEADLLAKVFHGSGVTIAASDKAAALELFKKSFPLINHVEYNGRVFVKDSFLAYARLIGDRKISQIVEGACRRKPIPIVR